MNAAPIRLPGVSDRVAVVGATGSGKTQLGLWLLSRASFDKQPWVIVDYKRDKTIAGSERIRQIGFREVPKQPGLYVLQPNPDEDEKVEEWLFKVWAHENVGLFIDEGYMLPQNPKGAFTYILTQGRSKRIPVIALSQRPKWVSRFVFSEATFFFVFRLTHNEDYKTVQEYIPKSRVDLETELPEYQCVYYDVPKRVAAVFQPVPEADVIIQTIDDRLAPKRRRL